MLHRRDQGSGFALAACATPSNAHPPAPRPPADRGPVFAQTLALEMPCIGWEPALGGNGNPSSSVQCVRAGGCRNPAESPLVLQVCDGAQGGAGGAPPESTSSLHRLMLGCETKGRCPVGRKVGAGNNVCPRRGFFLEQGDFSSVLHCGLSSCGPYTDLRDPFGKTQRHFGPPLANPGSQQAGKGCG